MADDKVQLLERIAKTNRVNLDQLLRLNEQLAELERAGISPTRVHSITRPLASPANPRPPNRMANAAPLCTFVK